MSKLLYFSHSGDMGDIIAGLNTVKEICEREDAKARIFLDTTGGKNDQWCMKQSMGMGLKFNKKSFEFLRPLIEAQPYVADCNSTEEIVPMTMDYNLNYFRSFFFDGDALKKTQQNLLYMHQIAFGLEMGYRGPWLAVPKREGHRKTLMARSLRYHSSDQLYIVCRKELEDGGFIGTDLEYQCLSEYFRFSIPRVPVANALEMAQEIQNSEKFICNGTLAYWLAVGMGHPNIVHELGVDIPTTYFHNQTPKIKYVMGSRYVE